VSNVVLPFSWRSFCLLSKGRAQLTQKRVRYAKADAGLPYRVRVCSGDEQLVGLLQDGWRAMRAAQNWNGWRPRGRSWRHKEWMTGTQNEWEAQEVNERHTGWVRGSWEGSILAREVSHTATQWRIAQARSNVRSNRKGACRQHNGQLEPGRVLRALLQKDDKVCLWSGRQACFWLWVMRQSLHTVKFRGWRWHIGYMKQH